MTKTSTACIATYESDAAYHADRTRLSGSALDLFADNPREYAAWMRGEFERKQTRPMGNGSFFHCGAFEPEEADSRFAIEPEDPERPGKSIRRNRNDYKAWRAEREAEGKTVIAPDFVAQMVPMVNALSDNPVTHDLLRCEGGQNEVPLHFEVDGRAMRAKLDRIIWSRNLIIELKTANDVDPDRNKNTWSWFDFGYHRKTWLYLDAYHQLTGRNACMVHIFVETGKKHPQVFASYTEVDSPAAQRGEDEVRRLLRRLSLCEEANDFRQPWEPGAPGAERRSLPLPGPILSEVEFANLQPVELDLGGGKTVTM